MTDKAAEAAHTEKGKEENPPPPYEHTELPETKKAVKHADDEPYDPFGGDYDAPPDAYMKKQREELERRTSHASASASRAVYTSGDHDPYDPLECEYGPPPEEYVAEQKKRQALERKESRSGPYDDTGAENDDYDALACDYTGQDEWRTQMDEDGKMNIYVDLAEGAPRPPSPVHETDIDPMCQDCPPMNIVIYIVGSRGDVQPYLALALRLITTRGHRVRLATHKDFHKLVTDASVHLAGKTDAAGTPLTSKLEFFDIGGNPHELMAYMVRNPGLVPGVAAIANGDIHAKRVMVKQILMGCYKASFSPNEDTKQPFAADAIISNPPTFAHIHVAEALGIPLIMSFTMPWSPTSAFPHPLVKAKSNRTEESMNNYSSFILADALMWQGLGDLINSFRFGVLGLQPLNLVAGPRVLERLKIPTTYAWSESLLPKPKDWRENLDVVGFYNMPEKAAGKVDVDPELLKFLDAGKPPIYIGFGSIVVKKPDELTATIMSAVKRTGVRAVISAGWAEIGGSGADIPESVLIVKGNVPHDWLFADGRVAAVCHHGGAGTTAAGLREGVPTIIVPFFGDQWFWGQAVHKAGAGPEPIPHADLTEDNLSKAIEFALNPKTREAAQEVGRNIRDEDGTKRGVESFHKHLPLLNMRCHVDPDRLALWWCDEFTIRLSGAAAAVLVEEKVLDWRRLQTHRPMTYAASRHYTDPFTAFGQSFVNVSAQAVTGTGQLFYAPARGLKNILFGVPAAAIGVIGSFQEGLDNVPGMIGSNVRRRRNINDARSGFTEGVKGLAYGISDGVSGLVTEPIEGAKKDGLPGLVSGAVKGLVNLVARPAGGALGLVVHPAVGTIRGARGHLARAGLLDNDTVLSAPRQEASHKDAAKLSQEERKRILDTWKEITVPDGVKHRQGEDDRRKTEQESKLLKIENSTWPLSESLVERLTTWGRPAGGNSFAPEATTQSPSQAPLQPEALSVPSQRTPSDSTIVTPSFHLDQASGGTSRGESDEESMSDLALAGTDRWNDWNSRPSSRASGGSFTAKGWVDKDRGRA